MDHDGTSESHRLNSMLGYVRPYWIPDEETDSCMYCDQKFTLVRRRHHCRACGKILCAFCCNKKMILPSMNFKMSRVCLACYHLLENDKDFSILSNLYSDENLNTKMNGIHPDPTKPEQYCSTIPPFMQAKNTANNIPVVYVPTSILKNGKSNSNKVYNHTIEHGLLTSNSDIEIAQSAETQLFEANVTVNGDGSENQQQYRKDTTIKKSVIFADGIRPGGDLSLESDNSFKYSSTSSSSNLFRKKHLISSSSALSSSSGKARQAPIMVIPAVAHIPPAILKFVTPSNNLLISPQQTSDDNSNNNLSESSHDRWISPTCTLFICSNLRLIAHLSYECGTHKAQYLHLRTNGMKGVGMSELSCIIDLSANQNYASKESLESIIYDFGYQFYRIYVDSLHGKSFSALDYISMYKRGPSLQNTNSSESNSQSSSSAELSSSSNNNASSSSSTNMRNSFLYDSCMSGFLLINLPHPSFVQANTNYRSLVCEHFYHYSSNVYNSNTNNINISKECLKNANAKMFHTIAPNIYIEPPRLYSLLIHKWEVSWAHLLPARLLYRLGYEYSYFPYPIVSSLDRKSTFFELNHTIMNLLADCKNFKYTLTRIPGLNILYDPKNSSIRILIQNQELEDIDSLITSFRISDHVLAFASDICRPPANSVHACIQHDEDFDVLSTTNYSNGLMAGDNGNYLPQNDKFDNDLIHQHTLHVCCENENTFTTHNEQKVITLDQNDKTVVNGTNNALSAPEIGGIHQSFVRKLFTNTENPIIEKDDLVINATFIVFNGSLKTHPNPAMKSTFSKPKLTPNATNISNQTHFENDTFETKNITTNSMFIEDDIKITQVEDGLMVHVNPNTITDITQALTKRIDFIIGSKPVKNTVINVTKKSPNTSLNKQADILPKNETSKSISSQNSMVDVDSLSLPPNTSTSPHLNELMQAFSITNTTLESPQWSYDDDYYVENSFQNYCNKSKVEKESKKDTNTNVTNLQANAVEQVTDATALDYKNSPSDKTTANKHQSLHNVETVSFKWSDLSHDEQSDKLCNKNTNETLFTKFIGKNVSLIDGQSLEHSVNFKPRGFMMDYLNKDLYIRLVEIYYLQMDALITSKTDMDVEIAAQDLSQAFCECLVNRLHLVASAGISQINLRITIDANNVGYEVSSLGAIYEQSYMGELDDYLIPIIHATLHNYGAPLLDLADERNDTTTLRTNKKMKFSTINPDALILELVFHILKM